MLYCMLVVGCWCWLLVVGCWLLVVGCCLLFVVVCCCLCFFCCLFLLLLWENQKSWHECFCLFTSNTKAANSSAPRFSRFTRNQKFRDSKWRIAFPPPRPQKKNQSKTNIWGRMLVKWPWQYSLHLVKRVVSPRYIWPGKVNKNQLLRAKAADM